MEQHYMTTQEEKIYGSNYPILSYHVKQILEEKEVWQVVKGDNEVNDDNDDDLEDDGDEPLAAIAVSPTNDKLVDIVLDAFPTSWDVFRTMIVGSEMTPTYMQLENLAFAEENKRKAQPEQLEEALHANMTRDLSTRLAHLRDNKPTANLAKGDETPEIFVDAEEQEPVADFDDGQEIEANFTELHLASDDKWFLDSGASIHLVKEQSALSDFCTNHHSGLCDYCWGTRH
ncbi:unnamed protein product [Calypogeia fissa]